jgi:hypothetical protein
MVQVLKTMSEADLISELGLDKFGIRRKFFMRISEVFKPAPVASVTTPLPARAPLTEVRPLQQSVVWFWGWV